MAEVMGTERHSEPKLSRALSRPSPLLPFHSSSSGQIKNLRHCGGLSRMQEAHLLTIKSASHCPCSQKALCHKAVLGWAELARTIPGVSRESHRKGMGTGDEEPHM